MKPMLISVGLLVLGGLGLVGAFLAPLEMVRGTVIDDTGIHVNAVTYVRAWWFSPVIAVISTALLIGGANLVFLSIWFSRQSLVKERKQDGT